MKFFLFEKSYPVVLKYVSLCFLMSCSNFQKNKTHQQVSDASIKEGKKLAMQYCGSCHQLPDPSLLDTKSWETGVLPAMGPRLGIFNYGFQQYPSSINDKNIGKNYYPAQPVLSFQDWQHIIDYYTAVSPDSLLPAGKPGLKLTNNLFQPLQPLFSYPAPATSFVHLQNGHALMCDALAKKLFIFNEQLHLKDSVSINGSATDVIEDADKFIICNTGILAPNNGKFGSVESISFSDKFHIDTLYKNLMRPVQINRADINNDGKQDYVVCEFGNLIGALSWLENTDTSFVRHVIRNVPGAIHTYINDYNKDGLPDVWALFAQGDEGIFLFTNKGKGIFDTKEVLRFPPSYGSSSFELDDFNKDGFADIVYTCGDNADYSPVLKPYHGVYVFLNDGKNNFTQKYFYPINGCYKAIARDFDNDGDLDIATIAFFADYKNEPQQAFVYLKNTNNYFTPYSLPAATLGRWLIMDAGDFDNDGKTDLMLGNFSIAPSVSKPSVDWTKQPPFLILKNIQ